jgi:hypothetical protein
MLRARLPAHKGERRIMLLAPRMNRIVPVLFQKSRASYRRAGRAIQPRSGRCPTTEEMNEKRNKSDHKQQVNSAARDVESKPSHRPHSQQNKKHYQKDEVRDYPHFFGDSPEIDKQSYGHESPVSARAVRLRPNIIAQV